MNIQHIKDCYGCGLCATVCGQQIINIELNSTGFYEPCITDAGLCTDCGLCINVCAYSYDELSLETQQIHSFAAWSNDPQVRNVCSSGGVGFEVGRKLINDGYKVCAVRYNADAARAEHYIASTIEELLPSIGSKYIQSYTIDAFRAINRKQKYLVTGTPCQIDSFRRYIRKYRVEENFVLMDFFCHGVPSMFVWTKYLQMVERQIGKVVYASWRNKLGGWHDSWTMAINSKYHGDIIESHDRYCLLSKVRSFSSKLSQGDLFYKLFLSDSCLGKACYDKCKYKYDRSSADIRIGDLWGKTYEKNEEGVSAAISFTKRGIDILKSLNCALVEHPFTIVAEGQMKNNPMRGYIYNKCTQLLADRSKSINDVYAGISLQLKMRHLYEVLTHPARTMVRIINRIKKIV